MHGSNSYHESREERGLRKLCVTSLFFEGMRGDFEGLRKIYGKRIKKGDLLEFFLPRSPIRQILGKGAVFLNLVGMLLDPHRG